MSLQKCEIAQTQRNTLLDAILPLILEKGPSHTTMDHVASCLGISKRTLYEIFISKDLMLKEVIQRLHDKSQAKAEEIFKTSENMMEAMVKVIKMHQGMLTKIRPDFFRDMDDRCKHLRPDYDSRDEQMNRHISRIVALGIKQGMFRKNLDLEMSLRLLRIQIESIKRMEDYFPPEITVAQAFHYIGQGFLRNIATQKGIEYLEKYEQSNS